MSEQSLFSRKDLIRLLTPLIIEQILAVLVGMVDVMMVGVVGESAVSGVSLVDSISFLIIQLLAAMATGGAVVCAQYLGMEKKDHANVAAGQLLLLTTLISVVISTLVLISNRHLLGLIFGDVEDTVMEQAMIYFFLSALSYPFLGIYNAGAALFRSMGNSKVSMQVSMLMNLINIVGNTICIFGLRMGVAGVGIPTLVSRIFAALVIIFLLHRPNQVISVSNLKALRFQKDMVRQILKVGVPNGLENSMFQFGKIALQSLVSSLGTIVIAGYAVAGNLVTLQYLPGNAIGLGLITIVGRCVGAGKYQQARNYTKKLILVNYCILICICSFMIFNRHLLIGLYQLSPQAEATSAQMLLVHSLAMIIWPLSFTLPYTLRASLDAYFTMTVSIASMWICRIGFAYIFVKVLNIGVMGIWYAMFMDWFIRAVFFLTRFLWKKNKVPEMLT